MISDEISLRHISAIFTERLSFLYPFSEIRSILDLLLEHYLHLSRLEAYLQQDRVIAGKKRELFQQALTRLADGEPVHYIIGETTFAGLSIHVSPGVLIPRPETEELATLVIGQWQNERGLSPGTALDIGTGSGCLAIALKQALPSLDVSASDIAVAALSIASENARRYSLPIRFFQDNILDPDPSNYITPFDLIVSNPPYIPASEKQLMHRNVTGFEPEEALFVPDDDPLLYYRAIQDFAGRFLSKAGMLFLELHEYHANSTLELFSRNNRYTNTLIRDFRGRDRFLFVKSG